MFCAVKANKPQSEFICKVQPLLLIFLLSLGGGDVVLGFSGCCH